MILSVIIVNFNVKYFLEQCLHSVEASLEKLGKREDSEVIVVDNLSTDGSMEYLQKRFPFVSWIGNKSNVGFAAANNQGLKVAKGKYIVFLNPDTILAEDSLSVCLRFSEARSDLGAAGVHMIDGSGRFLKESRRGYPSPWVGFCKLSGLTTLFPHSRLFSGYYLGHLSEHRSHPAPILSGAFFWTRREVLDKTGGFDERFFMYAEDIDLSYRIGQAGYVNYYIADTTIIHFKGESTRKDMRYTRIFYKAMSQFRRKYSRGGVSFFGDVLVELGIGVRGVLAGIGNMVSRGDEAAPLAAAWLQGDLLEVDRMRGRLVARGVSLAQSVEAAGEIILCQGKEFTFGRCISTVQQGAGQVWKIHAAGSDSLAGSGSQTDLPVLE